MCKHNAILVAATITMTMKTNSSLLRSVKRKLTNVFQFLNLRLLKEHVVATNMEIMIAVHLKNQTSSVTTQLMTIPEKIAQDITNSTYPSTRGVR